VRTANSERRIGRLPRYWPLEQEHIMARDFEDYCWKDVIDADTIQIY
jgi:hypothetical protein